MEESSDLESVLHPSLRRTAFEIAISHGVCGEETMQRMFAGRRAVPGLYVRALAGLSTNIKARKTAWEWTKNNWATLQERYLGNMGMLGFFAKIPVNRMADPAVLKDLEDFFADKYTKDHERDLEQAKETLRIRSKWAVRDGAALQVWLIERGTEMMWFHTSKASRFTFFYRSLAASTCK
ncbi:hypothetical protein BGZ58_009026 [Dissophora ornata]|nr:hypothetical protein BGZ58_009026 [Dissophora ornata]